MDNYNKFISDEYEKFYISSELGDIEQSWIYLQRIHIVSQSILVDHLKSHLNMLFYAVKIGDIKEIFGQATLNTCSYWEPFEKDTCR